MDDKLLTHLTAGRRAISAGDYLTAQNHYVSALHHDETCFEAAFNLQFIFQQTGRLPAAEAMARRALALRPNEAEAWLALGTLIGLQGRYEEAEPCLRKAVALKPSAATEFMMGQILYSLGRFDESIEAMTRALEHAPKDITIIDRRALVQLAIGKYRDGLIDNKVRWECVACHPLMMTEVPEWSGESLEGKSIVVLHEQGYGDTLQFCRFIPELKTKLGAKRVVLSVPAPLVDLMARAEIADEVIKIADLPSGGLHSMDFKSPTMTVPAHLDIRVETLSGKPYLKYPRSLKPRLPNTGKFKVGFCWAGKPMYADDQWRSMPFMALAPLFNNLLDVSFFSLQVDERSSELWQSGYNGVARDLAPEIKNWSDTAQIMQELDMVISVDTAPAHLAGALGVPVALMIPKVSCWRWLRRDSVTTPWYDSMRLFRQERQGDWAPVVRAVGEFIGAAKDQHNRKAA